MTKFYWECFRVGGEILQALAIGLDLDDENYLLNKHSGHNNQLRLLHYPPIPASALESNSAARCPTHTDWSSITLLFQDDCGGLQVEDPAHLGTFIPATPIKHAIIMNVGDLLQRWSNGLCPNMFSSQVCCIISSFALRLMYCMHVFRFVEIDKSPSYLTSVSRSI